MRGFTHHETTSEPELVSVMIVYTLYQTNLEAQNRHVTSISRLVYPVVFALPLSWALSLRQPCRIVTSGDHLHCGQRIQIHHCLALLGTAWWFLMVIDGG